MRIGISVRNENCSGKSIFILAIKFYLPLKHRIVQSFSFSVAYLLFDFLLEKLYHFIRRFFSVTIFIFFIHAHFRKSFFAAIWYKNRVVAKSLFALSFC